MRRPGLLLFLGLFSFFLSSATAGEPSSFTGYSAESARVERDWETKFRAIPNPENLRAYMQHLSARPHNVGSPYDKENAEWIAAHLKEWGWDTHIETFDVLYPTPKERAVELVDGGPRFVAKLQEPPIPEDPTSNQQSEQLPTYNAYSIDGDVTAPLVYVNHGLPSDYDQLERMGISVKGAIVIARYGASWRGIKPKVAAEHGAVGCLIYSDPAGDGYAPGDVFPRGPFRPRDGVQRGSVADDPIYAGDPLTPGAGATPGAKRLALKDVPVITKIPTLPLSYGDAEPLLAALHGPTVPENWRGALAITYHVGPGPAKVHLKVLANWDMKTIYDVIAKIPGASAPGEWIIRGNHHDAWVNGAEDPISGQVALLEEARALGELVKAGWKPKRTIIYCAWDGEEPGLIGSTEWAETHEAELREHAVAYLNSDSNGRGYLGMDGSHSLERFINEVARDITDPESNASVWKRDQLLAIRDAHTPEERQEARTRNDLRIGALGSGSDYGAFLDHIGIASLNLEFGGEDGGGIYHSIYDDFYWYTHYSDSQFVYGRALSQTVGSAVMRLADADLLPFDFANFADTIHIYITELKKLLGDKQDEIRERNREIEEGVFNATTDPKVTYVPPKPEEIPPHLNFAPLDNAADALTRSAKRYQKALEKAESNGGAALAGTSLAGLNRMLIESERKLTTPEGLAGRSWYRHQIYAPGQYTGYGVKTIPAVREAIELKKWKDADASIVLVGEVLGGEAALIDAAAAKLEALAP
jgi:N-acetylated-alpha-linked acidic dipeptidase